MEHIENALFNLDKTTTEFNEKQLNNVAKVIYETAEGTVESSKRFDGNFAKYFPKIETIGEPTPSFNPDFVVEFKDGKAQKEFTGWDREFGILPNRRVMGTYYIDVGEEMTLEKLIQEIKRGSFINIHFINKIKDKTIELSHQEHCEEKTIIADKQLEKEFEVDNYLNLYHKQTGLYLIFNKTAFPLFPFYDRDYIFKSKHWDKIKFNFDNSYYSNKDKREELLNNINEIVPNDYHRIYDYFNRFRMFPQYKTTLSTGETQKQYKETRSHYI
jgi:hypothetical protein